jgi:hypothetical protein
MYTALLCNNVLLNLIPLFIHHYMFRPLYKAIFRWVFLNEKATYMWLSRQV